MATLKQVAELAGVSTATASLALNKGPVNEETRKRVLACARQLNYVPNKVGRMLTTGKSNAIELLIMTTNVHINTVRKTTLFYYLLEGIHSVAHEAGYTLRFDVKSFDDISLNDHFDRVVGEASLDGIIIVPQFLFDYTFMPKLQRAKFPYVMLRPKRFGSNANYVDMANDVGAKLVADVFGRAGHRKIALINGPELHIDAIERERGFIEALSAWPTEGLKKCCGDFTITSGYEAMRELLKTFVPDALFCTNDYMAAGAMKALHEAGMKAPNDISVIGFDNSDLGIGLIPSLTTVDNRFEELGRQLALGVLDLIEGRSSSVQKTVTPILVERESHKR